MKTLRLQDVLESATAGYWGKEKGTLGKDVLVIRNGDLQTVGVRWDDLPCRALTTIEVRKSLVRKDDVLLTTSGECGRVALVHTEPMHETCVSNFVRRLRFKASVLPRYAYHYMRTPTFQTSLAPYIRGATIKNLSTREAFANSSFPVAPVHKQQQIVTILDTADAIRAKRRQVLARLDTLKQSVFHAMFGVPGAGSWRTSSLGEVIQRIDGGTSPVCESRPASWSEWGVLKLGSVTYGTFRPGENKAFLGEVGAMTENEVRPYDVLMTRKNTRELVGAVALVDDVRPRLLLPDLIFRLSLDETRLDRRYLQALMMHPQKRPEVRDLSSGSASSMPNISKARLRGLPIELPPLTLQREFAAKVEKINAQRAVVERALALDDELFASLQHRAFRGEL